MHDTLCFANTIREGEGKGDDTLCFTYKISYSVCHTLDGEVGSKEFANLALGNA